MKRFFSTSTWTKTWEFVVCSIGQILKVWNWNYDNVECIQNVKWITAVVYSHCDPGLGWSEPRVTGPRPSCPSALSSVIFSLQLSSVAITFLWSFRCLCKPGSARGGQRGGGAYLPGKYCSVVLGLCSGPAWPNSCSGTVLCLITHLVIQTNGF